jgi:hypothetical protein
MPRRGSVLVALAAFAIYAFLCPPVSGMGDGSEFTLVLATGGVAHPTGYPLYTLFGHLFCVLLHALGAPWPFAANLWSAAGGAVAIGFLHALGMELAGPSPGADGAPRAGVPVRFLAALIPVSLFAFQPIVLEEATRAEVNSWSLAWACGAACLFVRFHGALALADPAKPPRRRFRAAALWGLVIGIGLAHHLTSVLISAPLSAGLIVTLARRRRFGAPLPLVACGAALVPLASYGIIAWHAWHPAQVQWAWLEPGLESVVNHVTGRQYQALLGSFAPSALQKELLAGAVCPFLFPGLALLLLAVLTAKDIERRIARATLLGAALMVTIFTFRYGVPDPAPYFLPAMALGIAAAAPAIATVPGVGSRAGALALGAAGLAGSFLIVPWLREGNEVRKATLTFEQMIHSMWAAVPPDTAIVSWADDRVARLREYQVLRGEKPALWVITPDLLFADSVRRAMRRRFGVDPAVGFRPPRAVPRTPQEREALAADRQRLLRSLNERIRIPVILFDPTVPIVWQMRKPWEPRDDGGAPTPAP